MANARLEELKARFEENPRRYFAPFANELRKTGDFAQAISICRTHLATQPGHVSGHIVLAQALHEAGELDESRTQFEAALELDPENLIALRHMGDIARTRGDLESARGWYQRVLDADPRNDDIARVLRELFSLPNEAAPVAAGLATAPAAPEAASPATPPAPPTPRPPELSYGPPDPSIFAPPAASAAPAAPPNARDKAAPPPAATPSAQTPDAPAAESREPGPEALAEETQQPKPTTGDLDSFDTWYLPGTTRQLDTPAPAPESSPGPSTPDESHANEDPFHLAGELSTPDDSWLPKPTPAADLSDHEAAPNFWLDAALSEAGGGSNEDDASAGKPSSGYKDDIDTWFESSSSHLPPRDPSPASAEADPAAASHEEPSWMSGSEEPTGESTPDVRAGSSDASAPWSEPGDRKDRDTPGSSAVTPATVDPVPGRTPAFRDPAPETQATPFVTETLAELYLQQGFREEALDIYRQLVARDPGDEALRRRVEAIEAGESSDVVPGFTVHAPAPSERSSVSVRTFFGRLARRTAGQPRGGHEGGGQNRTPESLLTRPRTGAFPALPDRGAELSAGEGGGRQGGPSSSLANLFGHAHPSDLDTRAANALSAAFTESPMPGGPDGRPARLAERELSLDHLFRDGSDGSAGSTSMDEFYHPPAPGGAADSAQREPGAPEERTADLRQFTAWLEGLKKK